MVNLAMNCSLFCPLQSFKLTTKLILFIGLTTLRGLPCNLLRLITFNVRASHRLCRQSVNQEDYDLATINIKILTLTICLGRRELAQNSQ